MDDNTNPDRAMQLLHLKVVLAAIDTDESALETLRGAHDLATAAGARLHVVSVEFSSSDTGRRASSPTDARSDAARQLIDRAGLTPSDVELHLLAGEPAHLIRSLADKIQADVIILGKHRGGEVGRPGMGSTALAIVTNSWAPCLILSRPLRLPLERVLVAIDLSDTSRGALVVALSWASALRGAAMPSGSLASDTVALTALVVETRARTASGASRRAQALDDELNRIRGDAGTWAHVAIGGAVTGNDDVPQAIADYAGEHHSDLIVLGTRGLGLDGVGRVGSVSLGVLRHAVAPTLLVPPAVWSSYASAP